MSNYGKKYDVIVIGAGHAGCEAALASARMGSETLLLTIGLDTVAQMSCNPSIGGLAKGHLVHEVDALGGEMGLNIDETGIQFRRLNTRKGPAVRASRAQADRMAYSARMKWVIENQENLDLKQGLVTEICTKENRVSGVKTREGIEYYSRTLVVTTGTFMRGLIHVGLNHYPGGRAGEPSSETISDSLRGMGFAVGRLKTGTPARLASRSIDYTRLEIQGGDEYIKPFSFLNKQRKREQVDCYIAVSNEKTHEIIRNNLDKSPLYAGIIEGIGPRYCPSIEDKVVRFPEKVSHQSFLEPEGRRSCEMYPSGLSTSLPADVQLQYFRSMVGFEKVEIMRPGYAIEYDFVEPLQLKKSLETKFIEGLFHAGQINGTSGYEEAAAQGLIAGINAARYCQNRDPLILGRDQAYIGVMIDDLVTQPTSDPYRMFTSRSEYRLLLREDNADQRLTKIGRDIGLVKENRWRSFCEKQKEVRQITDILKSRQVTSSNHSMIDVLNLEKMNSGIPLDVLLKRPDMNITRLRDFYPELSEYDIQSLDQAEIAIKYEGYIVRQLEQVQRFREQEDVKLSADLDYKMIPSLSAEVVEKLNRVKPTTLGQAGRIQGVTPAALAVINVYLRKNKNAK